MQLAEAGRVALWKCQPASLRFLHTAAVVIFFLVKAPRAGVMAVVGCGGVDLQQSTGMIVLHGEVRGAARSLIDGGGWG